MSDIIFPPAAFTGEVAGEVAGESGAQYDITLGEVAANDLFGGAVKPFVHQQIDPLVQNILASFEAGGVIGSVSGVVYDSAYATEVRHTVGVVKDTAGSPSFHAARLYQAIGADATISDQVDGNTPYLAEWDGTDLSVTLTPVAAGILRLAGEAVLGASGSNIIPGFASGSNADGYWMKLYDKAGATLVVIQVKLNATFLAGYAAGSITWPTAFPNVSYSSVCVDVSSGGVVTGLQHSAKTTTTVPVFSYLCNTGAGYTTTADVIGIWVKA